MDILTCIDLFDAVFSVWPPFFQTTSFISFLSVEIYKSASIQVFWVFLQNMFNRNLKVFIDISWRFLKTFMGLLV